MLKLEDFDFYQVIELPDGRLTPGMFDHRDDPRRYGFDDPAVFRGKRVLDVAANDGFWSFWSERQGASEVVAIDVENYVDYDWGFDGPPPEIVGTRQPDKTLSFYALKSEFGSDVKRQKASIYDLNPDRFGTFNAVFVYGLLYHLRHPQLALDKARSVCDGFVVIETHVNNINRMLPHSLIYFDDVYYGSTNWCGPSEAGVVAWMRSAGFNHVFVERGIAKPDRQHFVGVVDEALLPRFKAAPNLRYCDDSYFAELRDAAKKHFEGSWYAGHAEITASAKPD